MCFFCYRYVFSSNFWKQFLEKIINVCTALLHSAKIPFHKTVLFCIPISNAWVSVSSSFANIMWCQVFRFFFLLIRQEIKDISVMFSFAFVFLSWKAYNESPGICLSGGTPALHARSSKFNSWHLSTLLSAISCIDVCYPQYHSYSVWSPMSTTTKMRACLMSVQPLLIVTITIVITKGMGRKN